MQRLSSICQSPTPKTKNEIHITAQPGPQSQFLSSNADIVVFGGAAGGSKLLPLDTPLPTPTGWITMGDIKHGDILFDETGAQCTVTDVFEIVESPELYRFTFDDGTEIDSCKDHLWHTYTASDMASLTRRTEEYRAKRRESRPSRAKGTRSQEFIDQITIHNRELAKHNTQPAPTGSVKTTLEIVNTLTCGKSNRSNHAIVVAGSLELSRVDLPIDPYLLGLWLGDGTSCTGAITTADIGLTNDWIKVPSAKYLYRVNNLTHKLKANGLLNNKHVPPIYLRGSREQRLALLQGLMDTDGCATKSGAVEFGNTNESLVDAVIELACSLGHKPGSKHVSKSYLNGKRHKDCYSVKWTAPEYVFRLERKMKLQLTSTRRTTQFRYIKSAKKIESRPGRCIKVSSPNRLYLAGSRMIPTHNSYSLLLEPLKHILNVDGFGTVIFRRTTPQIRNEGGLWDTSKEIYTGAADPKESTLEWVFPNGNRIKFAHLEYEKNVLDWQGSQIALIGFDELTHFTSQQFFYMMSRNRSTCGVKPYIRATCNPDADSWVAEFISWWINQETGYPIPERSGIKRWFIRINGEIIWADKKRELKERYPESYPKSVTFIPAKLSDNKILEQRDPAYRANLQALSLVDRERLLEGNWKIKPSAGNMFKADWLKFVEVPDLPCNIFEMRRVRWWDTAATEPTKENPDPDWCVGVLMGEHKGEFFILDVQRFRKSPAATEEMMGAIAEIDGKDVEIGMEQEPGSAGKREVDRYKKDLFRGFSFRAERSTGDKVTRAKPFSAACENGLVYILKGSWNYYDFINTLLNFPDTRYHDDDVDAASSAHSYLTRRNKGVKDYSKLFTTNQRY